MKNSRKWNTLSHSDKIHVQAHVGRIGKACAEYKISSHLHYCIWWLPLLHGVTRPWLAVLNWVNFKNTPNRLKLLFRHYCITVDVNVGAKNGNVLFFLVHYSAHPRDICYLNVVFFLLHYSAHPREVCCLNVLFFLVYCPTCPCDVCCLNILFLVIHCFSHPRDLCFWKNVVVVFFSANCTSH
jgi:hypothetical protein